MKYRSVAKQIVTQLGGKANIVRVWYCMTRLRLILVDENLVDFTALRRIPVIVDVVRHEGQLQLILGLDVKNYYEAFVDLYNNQTEEVPPENYKQQLINFCSGVFGPIAATLSAIGLLNILISASELTNFFEKTSRINQLMMLITQLTPFLFCIIIGLSVSKYFKFNDFITMTMLTLLVIPNWSYDVFNHEANISFSKSLLTILVSVVILIKLFNLFAKKIPKVLHSLLLPFLSIGTTIFIMVVLFGPLTYAVTVSLSTLLIRLYTVIPILFGLLFGWLRIASIEKGIHHLMTFFTLQHLLYFEFDMLLPMMLVVNIVLAGSLIEVIVSQEYQVSERKKALRAMAHAGLGITEPVIYQFISLKKYMKYAVVLMSMVATSLMAVFQIKSPVYVLSNVFSVIAYVGTDFKFVCFILIFAFLGSGVLTLGVKKTFKVKKLITLREKIPFGFVTAGSFINIRDVKDNVFSAKLLGDGYGVVPSIEDISAPLAGEITSIFPTKHAIGIRHDSGLEVLVHMGIETVGLKGEGFEIFVEEGQRVQLGDKIATMDLKKLKNKQIDTTIVVVITSNDIVYNFKDKTKKTNDLVQTKEAFGNIYLER